MVEKRMTEGKAVLKSKNKTPKKSKIVIEMSEMESF